MDFQYEREPLTDAMLNPAINSMHAPVRKLQNICRMLWRTAIREHSDQAGLKPRAAGCRSEISNTAGTLLRPRFNQTKISTVKVNQRVEGKSKSPKASKALRTDKESGA